MRRLLIGVGLMFVLVVSSGRALAAGPDESQLTALLRERYAAMKAAMAARDSKAISALLAPGFESLDVGGTSQTADQMLKGVSALPQDPNKVSQTTIVSVEPRGDVAIVVQRYDMHTIKPQTDGTPPKSVELTTTSTDTWLLKDGVWLLQRTVTDVMDYKVDDKAVMHKEHGQKP